MRRALTAAAALLALAGCPHQPDPVDAGTDAGMMSMGEHCLDRPGEMAKPPNGQLPCELLPPGFKR